ncbi:MAG: chitobiase/beta-hexosaminidase C-terminal domain-containing protein, partial [Bacteroidales bacterium]|nr:chitobiase/beta-hexosaminidase C-terminal domain-containing protein [Bacteroidales bacterium]
MWMTNVIVSKNASGPTKIRMRLALVPYGGDLEYSEEFTANYTVDAGAEAKPMAPTFTLGEDGKLSMENGYDEDDQFHMLCYKVGADADFEDLNVSTMYNYQYTAPITYTKGQTVKAVTVEMAMGAGGAPELTLSDVSTFYVAPDPVVVPAAPTFNPNGGEVTLDQQISLSTTTEGASIYYTMEMEKVPDFSTVTTEEELEETT